MFYIKNANTTEALYKCFLDHNNVTSGLQWPLCSVQMSANMHAAGDSETCIRRSNLINSLEPTRFCDPLSDVNLHYFVSPRNQTMEDGTKTRSGAEDSVLVVAARLDGVTMFDQTEVGFDSPTSGLVTLLAVANLVSQTMREKQLEYKEGLENIWFLLLNGESFDFSGSSRLLYDMKNNQFPHKMNLTEIYSKRAQPQLSLENIRAIVELGQLSNCFWRTNLI